MEIEVAPDPSTSGSRERRSLRAVVFSFCQGRLQSNQVWCPPMSDESTIRRLVRLSDALRDAVQNPKTFQVTPDEVESLNRILERIDQLISRSRKM